MMLRGGAGDSLFWHYFLVFQHIASPTLVFSRSGRRAAIRTESAAGAAPQIAGEGARLPWGSLASSWHVGDRRIHARMERFTALGAGELLAAGENGCQTQFARQREFDGITTGGVLLPNMRLLAPKQ
ncbi:hypothetical protein TcG_04160 [Trypanosoma cruzi]|nr:hypothetical protein TcG_04160 [Trypanosoma cruzi]